mmetsp:Transcript_7031/g.6307  ORF Transcript_7031/g.6307 Transcript_7031/m.6307 type:complete len:143 (+) Transcript_7031:497-925(+)
MVLVELSAERLFYDIGITVRDVPEDGNSFFHDLSNQLSLLKGSKILSCAELRQIAIDHIIDLEIKRTGFTIGDIDSYIYSMSQDKAWADNPVIHALLNYLRVNILIYMLDGSVINIYPINVTPENSNRIEYNRNHYVSVVPT